MRLSYVGRNGAWVVSSPTEPEKVDPWNVYDRENLFDETNMLLGHGAGHEALPWLACLVSVSRASHPESSVKSDPYRVWHRTPS